MVSVIAGTGIAGVMTLTENMLVNSGTASRFECPYKLWSFCEKLAF